MVIINIDTAKDSPEDIRKTIRYLQSMVGEPSGFSNPFADDRSAGASDPSPSGSSEFSGMMGMFGSAPDDDDAGGDDPDGTAVEDSDAFIEIVEY